MGLNDETTKIFLNTDGKLSDVDQEMLDFLAYIRHSTDEMAISSSSDLVQELNEKVKSVKNDKRFEVEWMTLLERDREKIKEGIEQGIKQGIEKEKRELAIRLLDILDDQTIAEKTELSLEEVKRLREDMK